MKKKTKPASKSKLGKNSVTNTWKSVYEPTTEKHGEYIFKVFTLSNDRKIMLHIDRSGSYNLRFVNFNGAIRVVSDLKLSAQAANAMVELLKRDGINGYETRAYTCTINWEKAGEPVSKRKVKVK